jgi:hypothetical protein
MPVVVYGVGENHAPLIYWQITFRTALFNALFYHVAYYETVTLNLRGKLSHTCNITFCYERMKHCL